MVTKTDADLRSCAEEILVVAPRANRWIRGVFRSQEPSWSVAAVQTLAFVQRNPGTGLSNLAEYLGVGLSTASALVTRLVKANLMKRVQDPAERRRVLLTLDAEVDARLKAAWSASSDQLVDRLSSLSARELREVTRAVRTLRGIFDNP
jgi:DNA-binding MarR family transcriptional regulator